jgi:hypothetical protein
MYLYVFSNPTVQRTFTLFEHEISLFFSFLGENYGLPGSGNPIRIRRPIRKAEYPCSRVIPLPNRQGSGEKNLWEWEKRIAVAITHNPHSVGGI